ncbi:MAG: hypothetical protein QM809_03540 [Gordonia sp. (in: high G+C Gram-positive bacteria)]|uniref:hypothetical protein n=1 Tax=Gordonia sp. (in: high G+C Gram-positive bacteria) TaxID=84139 RepID=UPI0039E2497D
MRIRADFEGHSTQRPLQVVVEYADGVGPQARETLVDGLERRIRSALNVKAVVTLVPELTLKRPDHVKVALIERG